MPLHYKGLDPLQSKRIGEDPSLNDLGMVWPPPHATPRGSSTILKKAIIEN